MHSNAQPGSSVQDTHHAVSSSDKAENTPSTSCAGGGAGGESRSSAPGLEHSWSFQSGFTPIDHHLHRSPSAAEDELGKFGMFSPSPCSKTPPAPVPYESFFDLALPRAASLFVGQKTSEAVHKATMERLSQWEEGLENGEEEGVVSASPLEVLDRLVQQGSDAHDKVLKRYLYLLFGLCTFILNFHCPQPSKMEFNPVIVFGQTKYAQGTPPPKFVASETQSLPY